jgi:hypothetical protein
MLSRLQADADRQFLFPRPAVFEPAFRSVLLTYILFLINVPPLAEKFSLSKSLWGDPPVILFRVTNHSLRSGGCHIDITGSRRGVKEPVS